MNSRFYPILFLILLSVLALFQVVFHVYTLKYDAIDCFYPWRFHVGECLQNGQLPYWNPFQDLGYPIHADPSSGAWYPVVWIIGYFKGYSLWTLGFEMWFHFLMGGIGFYSLASHFKFDQKIALFGAMAYMLCGLFVGNAQHFPYLISTAWLPFVLYYYFRMTKEKDLKNSLLAGFFLFLMVTGGYPAFTIILFYLLVIFSIIYFIRAWKKETPKDVLGLVMRHGVLLVFTILLCGGLFVSIYQVSPYLSRLGNFDLNQALFSPFSPQSFVSFVFPYSSVIRSDYFHSDLSMRNAYFGVFAFVFFVAGWFYKKPFEIKVLFYFGWFCLAAAVGEYLPVREFLYHYVPMMNVFRFPSVFRLFFILAAILTALVFLQKQFVENEWNKKPILYWTASALLVFIVLIFYARSIDYIGVGGFVKKHLFTESWETSLWQNLALQAMIHCVLLSVFLIVLWKVKKRSKVLVVLVFLAAFDLFIATQIQAPYTIYTDFITAKDAAANVERYPKGFPKQQSISIEESKTLPGIGQPFWQNQTTFQKQISAEGFNSFSFTSYELLDNEYPQLYVELQKNKVVLLSDSIVSENQLARFKKDSLFTPKNLFFAENDFRELKKISLRHFPTDTAFLTKYDAASFHLKSNTASPQLLTLFQKEYTGWKAFVDGNEVKIYKSDMNFMTIVLPAGKHAIEFKYANPILVIAFVISLLGSVLALGLLVFPKPLRKTKDQIG